MGLTTAMPIYVTRKDADGVTASYSASPWATLLAMALVWANIIAWGVYGLYAVGALVFA